MSRIPFPGLNILAVGVVGGRLGGVAFDSDLRHMQRDVLDCSAVPVLEQRASSSNGGLRVCAIEFANQRPDCAASVAAAEFADVEGLGAAACWIA